MWHGVDQSVALLRCYESPGCSDSGLQLFCIVGSGISHLPLHNTPSIFYGVKVRQVCWPIKSRDTMVLKPGTGSFGTVCRCQVLLSMKCSKTSWYTAVLTLDLRKHSGPTPADDMAPQTITDCGNFTQDLKQRGFCASPLFLQTLGP